MAKKASKAAAVGYGQCYWLWIGLPGIGYWVPDPVATFLGLNCTNGGRCVDPNTLGLKGRAFLELRIILCKPPAAKEVAAPTCGDRYCVFDFQNGAWVPRGGEANCNGDARCECTLPQMTKEMAT